MPAGRPMRMISRSLPGWMRRRFRNRRVGPSMFSSARVTSSAEIVCEMIVASATPATLR